MRRTTFGFVVDLHMRDLAEVGKPLLRSKAYTLDKLKDDLGTEKLAGLTRERIIAYAKQRAKQGAGAATIGMDIGYLQTILVHAAAVHGMEVPTEQVKLARVALRRLNLVAKGNERDRRPSPDELDRVIRLHHNNPRQNIPLGRIVKFAVATAMRQEEICTLLGTDVDFAAQQFDRLESPKLSVVERKRGYPCVLAAFSIRSEKAAATSKLGLAERRCTAMPAASGCLDAPGAAS